MKTPTADQPSAALELAKKTRVFDSVVQELRWEQACLEAMLDLMREQFRTGYGAQLIVTGRDVIAEASERADRVVGLGKASERRGESLPKKDT